MDDKKPQPTIDEARFLLCLRCLSTKLRRWSGRRRTKGTYAGRVWKAAIDDIINALADRQPWKNCCLMRWVDLDGKMVVRMLCRHCPYVVEHVTLAGRELDLVSEEDMIP